MAIRRKVPVRAGEAPKEAELVPINQSNEHWNEYILQDGSVVRTKAVVTEIWRVLEEWDQDGNPVYVVRSGNIVAVVGAENLRRGGVA